MEKLLYIKTSADKELCVFALRDYTPHWIKKLQYHTQKSRIKCSQ